MRLSLKGLFYFFDILKMWLVMRKPFLLTLFFRWQENYVTRELLLSEHLFYQFITRFT